LIDKKYLPQIEKELREKIAEWQILLNLYYLAIISFCLLS
jgi:hypothetical protein